MQLCSSSALLVSSCGLKPWCVHLHLHLQDWQPSQESLLKFCDSCSHSSTPLETQSHSRGRSSVYWGNIGIMEKKMETTIVYWGYIGPQLVAAKLILWVVLRVTPWNTSIPSAEGGTAPSARNPDSVGVWNAWSLVFSLTGVFAIQKSELTIQTPCTSIWQAYTTLNA